jgi:hypothetical protein
MTPNKLKVVSNQAVVGFETNLMADMEHLEVEQLNCVFIFAS